MCLSIMLAKPLCKGFIYDGAITEPFQTSRAHYYQPTVSRNPTSVARAHESILILNSMSTRYTCLHCRNLVPSRNPKAEYHGGKSQKIP